MDASDSTNRSLPLGARRINYWKGYSRRKITHDLPTLPVSQPYMPSSLSPLHISTASAQKVPTGKRKTDKEDACMPPTTAAADEATSSKRSKRHESGDVTVHHANGPTEPPVSSEKDMSPYQTPSENEIVPYRDLSVDAPSEEQIRPYWTQPKSPALHIEWVSSISKGSVESWKKDVEGKEQSEKNPSDRKPSNSPETSEDSAAAANDLSKPSSSVMQNKADTHRQTLQLESGAIPATQQSRPSKTRKKRKKVITAEPRQQENIRDPTEQAKPTIAEEEAVPTSRKTDNDDAKTNQSSLPTSLQEPGVSPQGREGMSHTRDFSLPVKLRQFALPGMGRRNDGDTSQYHVATSTTSKMPRETVDSYQGDGESEQNHPTLSKQAVKWLPMLDTRLHVLGWTRVHSDQLCSRNTEESTSTASKMPREMVDSYQRDGESARKHFTLSKEVVSSFPMPGTRLHGLAETRVYGDQPCQRNAEKDDENHVERTTTVSGMTSDIANCTPKEPETVDTNSHSSVLSSVLHEATIYKRQEGHSDRSSMNLHSSAMAPEPIAYSERQVQANDTPAVPQPSVSSYHGQDGQSATETHMEHRPSEPTTSYERERRLNHETTLVKESSLVFPYRRTSDESPGTQSHSGSPSSVIREALPSYQKLVQVNGSTVWVPRSFAAISPLSFRPLHVNPGITGHAHESYASPSSQIENIETRPQREPIPMESQEAMPNHHQVDKDGANSRENQTSEEQNAYNDQPATFLTQNDINFVIKQEPLSPLSDTVNEEERELIQGVLSGASLAESLEQQMLESGDAPPREMDWQDLQETGADEGSSSEKSDGSRKLTKLYYCPLCSYFTRHRGNIKQHVRVHTRERPFKCPLCEYTGARKEHVQVHMKRHTGERPFKCDHCDYRTSRKPDLVKHLRTHSGDRPYACPKCAYRAAVQSALVNHLRTHTGEKPYKCPFCNYCTARKRDLSKHMEKHSEDERCQAVEQYYYHLSSSDNTADDK
ncbi:uncharacterized protein LOC118406859 [Branchiostoma floridae]|uniref:Uncharacterized protein LOC118406859 n=1 Tax=Branchiostoma floridae TaxID=7739 RepID=A0A9J7HPG2_BRAFL|nr:uncharacterized protein LOC118406859 [Branchiostoma floridae]